MDRQIAPLRDGIDVVIATPGRLIDLVDRGVVSLGDVEIMVLDEADRMVDMGFLPQVEWLLRHVDRPPPDAAVLGHARRRHRPPRASPSCTTRCATRSSSRTITVDEMTHRFLLVHEMDKVRVLAAIARQHPRTLAFVRSKRGADQLAIALKKEGIAAAAIHGDLHQRHRERALAEFAPGRLAVLVATDVAARGLDIDDIGVVVHYDPPQDSKDYLHRSGRTARAGESGMVVTLVLWNEELEVRRMQRRLGPRRADRADVLQRPPPGRPGELGAAGPRGRRRPASGASAG